MFRNYLKMAWKVLGRRKFFTFVSLFGIGFTMTALLIAVAIADHMLAPSYPETRLDRMLILERMKMFGDRSTWHTGPGFKFVDRYARDLPGVERMSIYTRPSESSTFLEGRKLVFLTRFADAEFWRIMQFAFVEGAPFTADDDRDARRVAVIGEGVRRRFFGDADALGQSIELDGVELRVIGVVRDTPWYRTNSAADIWLPLRTQTAAGFFDRLMGGCQAAFLLEPGTDKRQVQAAFKERLTRVEFDDPERFHTIEGLPMTQLQVLSSVGLDPGETAPRRMILLWILGALAFMALPAINLVNINLSRIYERSSEIGVRKAFGAATRDLVLQFVVENVALSLIGGVIGLAGAFALLKIAVLFPQVPFLTFHLSWRIFAATLALAIVFGLLSGVWPAWKMSRQHPVLALRGGAS
jgi:putative ABC transport system permease protein